MQTSYVFELDFLNAFHFQKYHIIIANYDFANPSLSQCWKTYIKFNFFWFFFQFQVSQISFIYIFLLINPFNFLKFYWLILFILGSYDKLHIKALSSISLCTEVYMINSTETAGFVIFFSFMLSYWSILLISCNSIGSYSLYLDLKIKYT